MIKKILAGILDLFLFILKLTIGLAVVTGIAVAVGFHFFADGNMIDVFYDMFLNS